MSKIPVMRTVSAKQGLHDMCKYINSITPTKDMVIVEIGTFAGDSAVIFSEYFKEVITVDPYTNNLGDITNSVDMPYLYKLTVDRFKKYSNIRLMREFSSEAAKMFIEKSINVVYIDGMHTYEAVKKDINLWINKIKVGGWLCGHDYRPNKFQGVVKAVNEFRKPDKTFKDYSFAIKL